MAKKKIKTRELSELEMNGLIRMIENESYDDDYELDWDDKVTFIRVNEDSDGCSAYYGFHEDGPRCSVSSAYEMHTMNVGDIILEFTNNGDGDISGLTIDESCGYTLPDGELKEELISAINDVVSSHVELPDDGCKQFVHDWTHDEIIEEIESQLYDDEYIELDGKYYPADDWDDIVETFFDGKETDKDDCDMLDKHEVAERLADNIDCGGW